MIIESLTALSAGKVVWEVLEILYMVHIGHVTSKAGYQGGSSIARGIQQQLRKWQDQRNPGQRCEREAETPYDFKTMEDAPHQKIKKQAEAYLTTLSKSVGSLEKAKKYFLKTHGKLEKLVNASNEKQFSSQLLEFKINFESFKDEFNQFLLSIKIPPRQRLYIADLANGGKEDGECGIIKQFNGYLNSIKACLNEMENTKKAIFEALKKGFDSSSILLLTTSTSSERSVDLSQQSTEPCRANSAPRSETMLAALPENTELTTVRTVIDQISAVFQQTDLIEERTTVWEDNPNWWPLLIEEKQVEVGQRIFLHAMSEALHSGEEKLLLTQIFLRQPVSKYVLNQVSIDLLAHELARLLRAVQIKKCKQLTAFLESLLPGSVWPELDPDGLIEWLNTKRSDQSSIELFIGILVAPYCFSATRLESAMPRLKALLSNQPVTELIRKYKESYWGAIREKSDALIQLPKLFAAKLLPRDCIVEEAQVENSYVMSEVMHELAKKLIADLEMLTTELQKDYASLRIIINTLSTKEKEISVIQKDQEHKKGVTRIKKCHRYLDSIKSPSNSLFPYLYQAGIINEAQKKQQVATLDDLLYVIYKGVDPNGICFWKSSSSETSAGPHPLLYYFLQNQQDESLTKACIYAFHDCQANAVALFGHSAFSFTGRPLALENAASSSENTEVYPENTLSIDIILKDPNKIASIPTHSQALKEVSPKTKQEAETAFKQLQNYQVLALTRMNPKYINKLPLIQQLKYVIKNLFKSTQEIRQERLESVRIFIGDLCVVLSAEDTYAISQALDNFKINYEGRYQDAKRVCKSVLYTTMLRLINGPISVLISQFPREEQEKFKIEENKSKLQEQLMSMQETLNKAEQDKAAIAIQLKESEAQRVRDKAESEAKLQEVEAQRVQDKVEWEAQRAKDRAEWTIRRERDQTETEAKLKKLEARLDKLNQLSVCSIEQQPAANAFVHRSESDYVRFFKA